eukprot:gene8490-9357_t
MLPRGTRYQRIGDEEEGTLHGGNEGIITNPLQSSSPSSIEMATTITSSTSTLSTSQTSTPPTTLRLLYKEEAHEITGLSGETTVAILKEKIGRLCPVPLDRQRLIASGRQLRPDDAPLSTFKLVTGAAIHLFPLPPPQPVVAVSVTDNTTSSTTQVTAVPANTNNNNNNNTFNASTRRSRPPGFSAYELEGITITPMHFDASILETGREVKVWSVLLIFLSAVSLFNNLSYFGSTGKFGSGNLDSFVFLLDTACSAAGMVVGGWGLKSTRTLQFDDVRKYVKYLVILAAACIVLRIFWVVDVSAAVEKAYNQAKKDEVDNDNNNGGGDNSGGGDSSGGNNGENGDGSNTGNTSGLDRRVVIAFTIQAIVVACICIGAWASCVSRAVRLHNAVQAYQTPVPPSRDVSSAPAVPAVATVV